MGGRRGVQPHHGLPRALHFFASLPCLLPLPTPAIRPPVVGRPSSFAAVRRTERRTSLPCAALLDGGTPGYLSNGGVAKSCMRRRCRLLLVLGEDGSSGGET